LSPARPNGIALHEIITSAHITNDSDYINLTISMEIVPSSCDYDIPLINITVIDVEATPGMSHAAKVLFFVMGLNWCSSIEFNNFAWLH
jgi:type 1 fimbria pilin